MRGEDKEERNNKEITNEKFTKIGFENRANSVLLYRRLRLSVHCCCGLTNLKQRSWCILPGHENLDELR